MKFGNPISDVNATIIGTVPVSGNGLGISSIVSSSIPATNSVVVTGQATSGTKTVLPISTGSTQYILIAAAVQVTSASYTMTLQGTGTSSMQILQLGGQNPSFATIFPLYELLLPVGAGISVVFTGGFSLNLTLYYATINSATPYVSGYTIAS